MAFGVKLKELRTEKKLTQLQMANILETSKSNISKYEAGNVEPSFDTLLKISKFFNVSVDYLLGINDEYEDEQEETFWQNEKERNLLEVYRYYEDKGFSDDVLNKLKEYFPEVDLTSLKAFTEQEIKVIEVFRQLNEDNRDIIIGDMKKYLKEQRYETSVAADEQMKQAK